jgi:acetamidase/formamidase
LANETAADITLSCQVIRNKTVPGICRVIGSDYLYQIDSARNAGSLELALSSCFTGMINWLAEDYGISRREAYIHMSANSLVRTAVYQFTDGMMTCGVEFPRASIE